MNRLQIGFLFALRVSLGWLFLYSGITKVLDSSWTSAGYLQHAQSFEFIFRWLAQPAVLPAVDFLNSWGQLLIGVSLILGLFVSFSAVCATVMMTLYYLALPFPKVDEHSFVVDQHIVYALSLLVLAVTHAGEFLGLDCVFKKRNKNHSSPAV